MSQLHVLYHYSDCVAVAPHALIACSCLDVYTTGNCSDHVNLILSSDCMYQSKDIHTGHNVIGTDCYNNNILGRISGFIHVPTNHT